MPERFVITGAPGSGKTPILRELVSSGFTGVPEVAREVLAEQRASGGRGVPDVDPEAFCRLMLERAVHDFRTAPDGPPVFFDRGIADLIGYGRLFGLDTTDAERNARTYRYDDPVFFTPSWPEIYTTDDERTMSFEAADAFGRVLWDVYVRLGYELLEVPPDGPRARADFVIESLARRR